MIKKIAIVVAIIFASFLGYAASMPDTFRIERSAIVNAPPAKVFPYLNSLRDFGAWSPWEKKDPNMKRTFRGPESGKGAAYEWDGNDDVGAGRMEITNSTEPTNVAMSLDFVRPFKGHNTVEFNLIPKKEGTEVVWTMEGHNEFMCKIMQIFVNADEMCGKDFDAGLANLKSLAEQPAPAKTAASVSQQTVSH